MSYIYPQIIQWWEEVEDIDETIFSINWSLLKLYAGDIRLHYTISPYYLYFVCLKFFIVKVKIYS